MSLVNLLLGKREPVSPVEQKPSRLYPSELVAFYTCAQVAQGKTKLEYQPMADLAKRLDSDNNFRLMRFDFDRSWDNKIRSGGVRSALSLLVELGYAATYDTMPSIDWALIDANGLNYSKETVLKYHQRYPEAAQHLAEVLHVPIQFIITEMSLPFLRERERHENAGKRLTTD
jgi:hypothetical protein